MKRYYDEDDNQYILLEEMKLEQGLLMSYSVTENVFIVVDPDIKKNCEGKPYDNVVKVVEKDTGTELSVGVVQTIGRKAINELKEMFDYLELEKL